MKKPFFVIFTICQIMFLLIVSGCRPPIKKSFASTEEHYHASDIRNMVAPLFLKYNCPTNYDHDLVIPFDEVPKEIKSLPLFLIIPKDELLIMTTWEGTNNDALAFVAGGGFGHWGIFVCRDENDRQFDNIDGYTFWEKGIYFYSEIR